LLVMDFADKVRSYREIPCRAVREQARSYEEPMPRPPLALAVCEGVRGLALGRRKPEETG